MEQDVGRCGSAAALAGSALSPFGSSPSAPAANAHTRRHCLTCGLGYAEYLACEAVDCKLSEVRHD